MLFMLFVLFSSKKSKKMESTDCLLKAKSYTFCVLFFYFLKTTLLVVYFFHTILLGLGWLLVNQTILLSLVVLF